MPKQARRTFRKHITKPSEQVAASDCTMMDGWMLAWADGALADQTQHFFFTQIQSERGLDCSGGRGAEKRQHEACLLQPWSCFWPWPPSSSLPLSLSLPPFAPTQREGECWDSQSCQLRPSPSCRSPASQQSSPACSLLRSSSVSLSLSLSPLPISA